MFFFRPCLTRLESKIRTPHPISEFPSRLQRCASTCFQHRLLDQRGADSEGRKLVYA